MRRVVLIWCLGLWWLSMASIVSATFLPVSTLVHAENGVNVWTEQPLHPDAGDVDSPQNIQGTNITEIDGIIGSNLVPLGQVGPNFVCIADVAFCCPPPQFGDCADAFRFFFGGGAIQFTGFEMFNGGTPVGAGPAIPVLIALPLQLFSDGGANIITPDTLAPGCAPGFPCYQIGFNNLAAGNYILRATENLLDPPYVITISTGIDTPRTNGVPEPEELALFAAALIGCIVVRRRSRAA